METTTLKGHHLIILHSLLIERNSLDSLLKWMEKIHINLHYGKRQSEHLKEVYSRIIKDKIKIIPTDDLDVICLGKEGERCPKHDSIRCGGYPTMNSLKERAFFREYNFKMGESYTEAEILNRLENVDLFFFYRDCYGG